jgi:hypothetical protein
MGQGHPQWFRFHFFDRPELEQAFLQYRQHPPDIGIVHGFVRKKQLVDLAPVIYGRGWDIGQMAVGLPGGTALPKPDQVE